MTSAAKNNEIYHLWWHPHNFGDNLKGNLKDLEELFIHFEKCKKDFGFKSLNMKEIYLLEKTSPGI